MAIVQRAPSRSASASRDSPRLMKWNVAMMATRRDHRCGERGESVEQCAVLVREPAAEMGSALEVHEVPVVHMAQPAQVQADDLLARALVGGLRELAHHDEKRNQALLMDLRSEQSVDRRERQRLNSRATSRCSPTVAPMKTSPSPYSPLPVLKKRATDAARSGRANGRSSRRDLRCRGKSRACRWNAIALAPAAGEPPSYRA